MLWDSNPRRRFCAGGLKARSDCRSGQASGAAFAAEVHHGLLELVQAGGVEPPATRLSAGALAVRTGLRCWCVFVESNHGPLVPPILKFLHTGGKHV